MKEVMKKPLILEIKGNSLDDGPGIRTVVFFKGCPLSCAWCHNPESKSAAPEISFDPGLCAGCGACAEACGEGAIDARDPGRVVRSRCTLCFECADECPSGAISRVGRRMEVEEIAAEVHEDIPFFRTSGGGVTLSGGEPTLFMDYASELLERLKEMGVNTLLETCGLFEYERFERAMMPSLDCIYYDLKLMDPGEHLRRCGTRNDVILSNFRRLAAARGAPEVLARLPLVPGITTTRENLRAVAGFLRENGVGRIALMEYNPLWIEKDRMIGGRGPAAGEARLDAWMAREEVERCRLEFDGLEVL